MGKAKAAGIDVVVADVVKLLEEARHASTRAVNSVLTATYWAIGKRIVEEEQRGGERAKRYGEEILEALAVELTKRFGRGFGKSNVFSMRLFFLAFQARGEIFQTVSGKSPSQKVRTLHGQSSGPRFPLSWSHYVCLLGLDEAHAREFYEREALRGGWSVRQLRRQIATKFYERTALSKKVAFPKLPREAPSTADEEIKDPYVLEFLGLKDEYSESDLEDALIEQLEAFLLELGGDFAFIGRQRRCRIGDQWHRVDLLLFHRGLRCLVLIDLKLDAFKAGDVGQMNLYVNYAREHWTRPDENPPVGLILSAEQNHAVAKYALGGIENKIAAAEYRTALPDERQLAEKIDAARRLIEGHRAEKEPT